MFASKPSVTYRKETPHKIKEPSPCRSCTEIDYRFFLTYLKNDIYNFSVCTIFFKHTDENEFLFTHGAYNLLNSECTPLLIGFNAILKWEYIN